MRLFILMCAKVTVFLDKYLAWLRKRMIKNHDFSIICNNCWAGYVYRRYGLPYLTPTVGLYFFADDFVKLCTDLRRYMDTELEFIPYTESKYKDLLVKRGQQNVPIARLDDIEVVFLHYKTREEAKEKWERRVKRINYDNLIIKFSKMDLCSQETLTAFDALVYDKKFCFVPPEDAHRIKCAVPFQSCAGMSEVTFDTAKYARYINLTKLINAKKVCGKHME